MQERTGNNAGARAGNRVRGAFETLHGLGENIRGNALSAVDAAAGDGPNHNDDIAARGRLEAQNGVRDMRGGSTTTTRPTPTHTAAAPTAGSTAMGSSTTAAPHVHHHRDDAISGLPNGQIRELQGQYEDQGGFRRPQYN